MLTRRTFLASAAAAPFALGFAQSALASEPAVFSEGGIAIRGTDPVAYFTEGAPVAGSSEFTADWNGATWHFASAANREAFTSDPDAYAPQYGGYCAWAVSQGYTASISPNAWSIHRGKLYLNFNRAVRTRWSLNKDGNIAAADANWPTVLDT
ncbi:MAG: YHS domain-containing (seleno)protein [Pseudomonadota bacterium]